MASQYKKILMLSAFVILLIGVLETSGQCIRGQYGSRYPQPYPSPCCQSYNPPQPCPYASNSQCQYYGNIIPEVLSEIGQCPFALNNALGQLGSGCMSRCSCGY